ncbi:MAG TPA: DUF5686 family protein [Vicinamibacterales bacterium]|nr:DUF5686 family protein [Vicinamibacterales bacterium]
MRTLRAAASGWVRAAGVAALLLGLLAGPAFGQTPTQPVRVLQHLTLEGATVFTRDDVLWLLALTIGEPLGGSAEELASELQGHYRKGGYEAATVEGAYDAASGRLTLQVDEGRIDEIEFTGIPAAQTSRFREQLGVRPGDLYNARQLRERLQPLLDASGGALRIDRPGIDLVSRDGRRILVVPIDTRAVAVGFSVTTEGREDFFSPVDGFAPALAIDVTRFNATRFTHTFVNAYVTYKFAREEPGYSAGFEQQLLERPGLWAGATVHDLTASDDLWRLSTTEQSVVALTFRNTFRDYYRRRGTQVFAALRPHANHELVASMRWDRHESLENATDFAFFRDDHEFRPNAPIPPGRIRALVLAYSWDTRGVADGTPARNYAQHLIDDLFRGSRRQGFGARVDWTTEIAGHGLGGDREYDRHVLNARGYLPLTPRQSLAARALLGFSNGELPPERQFALGGIGSVHGYAFKEARGGRMTLFNAEYRLDLLGRWEGPAGGVLRALLFFDAGRVHDPIDSSSTDWLRGVGIGLQTGPVRVEFGFRADDVPESRQVLVRLGSTF